MLWIVEQPQTLSIKVGERSADVLRGVTFVDAEPLGRGDVGRDVASEAHLEGAVVRLDGHAHGIDGWCFDGRQSEESVDAPVHLLLQRHEDAALAGALGEGPTAGVAHRYERGRLFERGRDDLLGGVLGHRRDGLFRRHDEIEDLGAQVVELRNRKPLEQIASKGETIHPRESGNDGAVAHSCAALRVHDESAPECDHR